MNDSDIKHHLTLVMNCTNT